MEREFEAMEREYNSRSAIFQRLVTLGEYCSIMIRRMNRQSFHDGRVIPKFLDKQQSEEKTRSLEKSHKSIESCTYDKQLDGHDDNTHDLSSRSDIVENSTLHHSGDTCEDSAVSAPRHEEDQRLGDPPLDVDMRLCMGDNNPPMDLIMTHSLPSQSFMLDTMHEDISGIPNVVEHPCVVIEHKGHVDPQAQEEMTWR